jgi:hypothetical protein
MAAASPRSPVCRSTSSSVSACSRIVLLRNWDVATRSEGRALGDFVVWRRALTSVTDIGAYRDVTRNLITGTDDARPVQGAEMTASGFVVASAGSRSSGW